MHYKMNGYRKIRGEHEEIEQVQRNNNNFEDQLINCDTIDVYC